jgi:hypothetical protein
MLRMGKSLTKSFKILTVCTALYMPHQAEAVSRCTADLQRVDLGNCLNRAKPQHTYNWSLTDQSFNIEVNACLNDQSANGTHKDIVIAIDRSASNLIPDKQRKKLRADAISVAIDLIGHLESTYRASPEKAPNISVVMFSSDETCREYAGGKISFVGDFPCVYTRAAKVTDEQHRSKMLALLNETEGKYSAGTASSASDMSIVAGLVRDRTVMATEGRQSSVALFSTGLSYAGTDGDVYSFLKSQNYESATAKNSASFAETSVRRSRLVIMTAPLAAPYYGSEYRDSFENMCALPDAPSTDCAADSAAASTWLVNKFDTKQQLAALAAHSNGIVKESSASGVALDLAGQMVIQGQANVIPDQVTLTVDGQPSNLVALSGEKITIHGVEAGKTVNLGLNISAAGETIPFTFNLSTNVVEGAEKEFTDREMFCAAETAQIVEGITLKDLQGGSGSCGVVGFGTESPRGFLFVLLLPLAFVFFSSGRIAALLALLGAGVVSFSSAGVAEEKVSGLNSQHYRPAVDGVGNTENGRLINPGTFNAGIYGDYANDPVEIGGEKGKRVKGVTDDMVTAHFAANIGLFRFFSLGMHVPYVHKTDIDREVEGEQVDGGSLGQPADSTVFAKIGIVQKAVWSLALMPQYTIATGNSEYLIGDGTPSYGATLALSGVNGGFLWASNFGYMQRQEALVLSDDRTNEIKVTGFGLLSFGGQYRINGLLSAGGSLFGKFHSGERFDFSRTNPAEWQALMKAKLASTFEGSLGIGTGIGKGYGAPDYRVVAGFTYVPAATKTTVRQIAGPAKKK